MDEIIKARLHQHLKVAKEINKFLAQNCEAGADFTITQDAVLFELGFIEFSKPESAYRTASLFYIAGFEIECIVSITCALATLGYEVKIQPFIEWNDDGKETELVPLVQSNEESFVDETEKVFLCGYKILEPNRLDSPTARFYIKRFCKTPKPANKLAI
ncbi:MAG: hypothetical protein IPJ71_12495 [Bdellovibrionales bacterium]|nr:hypothetical protein [Bdellovibrionales bacterium]